MRVLVAIVIAISCFCLNANGQLVCLNSQAADTTSYTNGMHNDSVYFVCGNQNATVVATPTSGIPGWNFRWYFFSSALNAWVFASEDVAMPTSSRSLPNGGFKVEIFDASGSMTESYICWVCRVFFPPIVNANTIPAGCTAVQLSGLYFAPQITSYFNPPPVTTDQPLIVDANTEIEVCFDVNHSFVSDLSFHLIGPASCGSPHAILSPAPFELQEDTMCNSGSDAASLCFANTANANLDVCENAPFTLTGNYSSYGAVVNTIDWSVFFGCDANEEDWSVQVYDCVAGVQGWVTNAALQISVVNVNGDDISIQYGVPNNSAYVIVDDACELDEQYYIPLQELQIPATIIPIAFNTEWVADPPFDIPNPINDLSIVLDPAPTVDTYFTLKLTGPAFGNACDGNTMDVEFYDYITPDEAIIESAVNVFCVVDSAINLISTISDGLWSGQGIINSNAGIFDPSSAGPGIWEVEFIPESSCIEGSSIQMIVTEAPTVVIESVETICDNSPLIDLNVNTSGGVWAGIGIVNAMNGVFDPGLVSGQSAVITYQVGGVCPAADTLLIEMVTFVPLVLNVQDESLCLSHDPVEITTNLPGGTWTGNGISADGVFDPALVGDGEWQVTYTYDAVCADEGSITFSVDNPFLQIEPVAPVCFDAPSFELTEFPQGGVWSGNGIVNQITGLFNPNAVGMPGNYTVYYEIDNACNPIDSITVILQDYPVLDLLIPQGVCPEAAAFNLDANIAGGVWSGDGVSGGSFASFDPALAQSGNNTITYSVNGVCDVTQSETIIVYSQPTLLSSQDTAICPGDVAPLWVSGAVQYNWLPVDGLSQNIGNEVFASPDQTTVYTVSGYSEEGCLGETEIQVVVFPSPEIVVNGPFDICQEESVQLIASGLTNYTWSGDGLNAYDVPDPLADPNQSTSYVVAGFDSNGCYGEATIDVQVILPVASFESDFNTGVSPFNPSITNTSFGEVFYWDFGNGDSLVTYDVSQAVQPEFIGLQEYMITLTSAIGECISTYSAVFSSYYDSELLVIPNIVTMDGNNKNDYFRILCQNIDLLDVEIYDRWGRVVGAYSGPDNKWDPAEFGAGTYYYHYKAKGLDGEDYLGSGNFTVLKKVD
jgi:hypothetical protein